MALDCIVVSAPGGTIGPQAVTAGVHEDDAAGTAGADPKPGAIGFDSENSEPPGSHRLNPSKDIIIIRREMQVRTQLVVSTQIRPHCSCIQQSVNHPAAGPYVDGLKGGS